MMRILIVSNGLNYATDLALDWGASVSARLDEPPTLLKVLEQKGEAHTGPDESVWNNIPEGLKNAGAQTKTRVGVWSEQIIRETRAGGYDLMIIEEKKPSGQTHFYQPKPQAIKVVEQSPCSVLLVRGKARPVHRILLCDSGAAHQAALSRFTDKMKTIFEGHEEITVLHVMSQISAGPGVRGRQLRANAETLIGEHSPEGDLLLQVVRVLEKTGFHPLPKVRHGLVLDEILSEAQNGDYDLVVIGAHRNEGLRSFLLDNLARKLIARLDRPVLVLK
jgi:nucleotide-binding universal stress UspA family protein